MDLTNSGPQRFTCAVCLEAKGYFEPHAIVEGEHHVCAPCLERQFEAAIASENSYPPRWAGTELHPSQFERIVDDGLLLRYAAKELEYKVPPAERIYCAHRSRHISSDAEMAASPTLPVTPGAHTGGTQNTPTATTATEHAGKPCNKFLGPALDDSRRHSNIIRSCALCHGHTCMLCGERHKGNGHLCTLPVSDRQAFKGLELGRDYQICPNERCRRRIQIIDGCNHLICLCGQGLCFLCGAKAAALSGHWNRDNPCPRYGRPGEHAMWDHRLHPRFADMEAEDFEVFAEEHIGPPPPENPLLWHDEVVDEHAIMRAARQRARSLMEVTQRIVHGDDVPTVDGAQDPWHARLTGAQARPVRNQTQDVAATGEQSPARQADIFRTMRAAGHDEEDFLGRFDQMTHQRLLRQSNLQLQRPERNLQAAENLNALRLQRTQAAIDRLNLSNRERIASERFQRERQLWQDHIQQDNAEMGNRTQQPVGQEHMLAWTLDGVNVEPARAQEAQQRVREQRQQRRQEHGQQEHDRERMHANSTTRHWRQPGVFERLYGRVETTEFGPAAEQRGLTPLAPAERASHGRFLESVTLVRTLERGGRAVYPPTPPFSEHEIRFGLAAAAPASEEMLSQFRSIGIPHSQDSDHRYFSSGPQRQLPLPGVGGEPLDPRRLFPPRESHGTSGFESPYVREGAVRPPQQQRPHQHFVDETGQHYEPRTHGADIATIERFRREQRVEYDQLWPQQAAANALRFMDQRLHPTAANQDIPARLTTHGARRLPMHRPDPAPAQIPRRFPGLAVTETPATRYDLHDVYQQRLPVPSGRESFDGRRPDEPPSHRRRQ